MKRIIAVVALLVAASAVHAGCPTFHRAAVVKQQVVVAPVVQALAAVVPTYGAGYTPYQQQADPELLRQILEELRAMRQELRALQGQPGQAGATDVGALIGSACAKCHTDGSLDKGTGFVMVEKDGKLSPLSIKEKDRIQRRIENGSMPPPKSVNRPLTDNEKKSLVEALTKSKE